VKGAVPVFRLTDPVNVAVPPLQITVLPDAVRIGVDAKVPSTKSFREEVIDCEVDVWNWNVEKQLE